MKIQAFFLLLFFAATQTFAQTDNNNQDITKVYHNGNNITLKNYDGTLSSIYVSGGTATLFNADGTQTSIDFCSNSSNLIGKDGSFSSSTHNGASSSLFNSDGTRLIVNHMQTTSSCVTENGKHYIRHTFGNVKEMGYKNKIDVLIHRNWMINKRNEMLLTELKEVGLDD